MRRRVFVFVYIVLMALAIAPAFNVVSNTSGYPAKTATNETKAGWASAIYNLDFASSWLNRLLYQFGISTDPTQAIVGREGWLYLGDRYAQKRSVARRGQTARDVSLGCKFASASIAWETFLQRKGVRLFRLMIAPDKGTIYPEHLPNWAKPAKPSAIDALVECAGNGNYLDLRPALWRAKNESPYPLYYATDTHWNSLGAAYAFSSLMDNLLVVEPTLSWEPDRKVRVVQVDDRSGGDLARLLHLQDSLADYEPVVAMLTEASIETTVYDFESGEVVSSGGNSIIRTPQTALRVVSPHALNKKKVLWLRDSFGTALAPFMAATFTETVQIAWNEALGGHGETLIDLVDSWHPDYVVVTLVEREAFSGLPSIPPAGGIN